MSTRILQQKIARLESELRHAENVVMTCRGISVELIGGNKTQIDSALDKRERAIVLYRRYIAALKAESLFESIWLGIRLRWLVGQIKKENR